MHRRRKALSHAFLGYSSDQPLYYHSSINITPRCDLVADLIMASCLMHYGGRRTVHRLACTYTSESVVKKALKRKGLGEEGAVEYGIGFRTACDLSVSPALSPDSYG